MMGKKELGWLTSCISWIEDKNKRTGVIELIKDSYRDDPEFNPEEFAGWVEEKVFLNMRDHLLSGPHGHHVSRSCGGQVCGICGVQATHKVGEEIMWDDPCQNRHNYTSYVCCACFEMILGPAVPCRKENK